MWDNNDYDLGMQLLGYFGYGGYHPGGFLSQLLTTWSKADFQNKSRLELAFPELAQLLQRFNSMSPDDFRDSLETQREYIR